MRGKDLLLQILCAAAIFVGFNLLALRANRDAPPRQLMRRLNAASPCDAIFVGNSLMASGFDPAAYRQEERRAGRSTSAFNLGLGATWSVEHLLLLHRALAKWPHPDLVVYGFFDLQLTDTRRGPLIGNRAMDYYIEPQRAARYLALSSTERAIFELRRRIPYLAEQSVLWEKVERLRRQLAAYGVPTEKSSRFGRAADFALLEAGSARAFQSQCRAALNAPLSVPMQDLIRLARRQARRTVIVVMPLTLHHLQSYYAAPEWSRYLTHVRALVTREDAELLDASGWIPEDAEFADSLHLNASGAARFSRRLSQALHPQPPLHSILRNSLVPDTYLMIGLQKASYEGGKPDWQRK